MPLLKRCVSIINHRSGHRHSVHTYTDTLKQYMDRAGIVHHDIHIPNDDVADHLRRALPTAEALVICGGDGTVNHTVNLLAAMDASAHTSSLLSHTPLLLVPTGLHNSIATSLGVGAAERAVSGLVVGRTVRVPLWAVRLHPPHTAEGDSPSLSSLIQQQQPQEASPSSSSSSSSSSTPSLVRYMCSYVAVGTYAAVVRRQQRWKEAQEDYVSLPALLGTQLATSLFTTVEHATPGCVVQCSTAATAPASATATATEAIEGESDPLRLVVAAQMPQLLPGYSLTPTATYHQHQLSVTTATNAVSRLRMWHLLRREAREGYILAEDGVAVRERVQSLRIRFPRVVDEGSTAAASVVKKRRAQESAVEDKDGGVGERDEEGALMVVDGECVRVPHGSSVTVSPTNLTAQFIVS